MKQKLILYISVLLSLTILLSVAQYIIQTYIFPDVEFFYSLWSIYGFNFIMGLIVYVGILAAHNILPEKTGFTYLAMSGLKMLAAIVFLVPLFQASMENPIPTVFSFFIPYFVYLFLEVFFVIKLLK